MTDDKPNTGVPAIRPTSSRGNEAPMVIGPRRLARLLASIVRRPRRGA